MSTLKSPGLVPNQSAFEVDMRNLLRARKTNGSAEVSTESEERNVELASQISQISFQSVQEIDRLIAAFKGYAKNWMMTGIAFNAKSGST